MAFNIFGIQFGKPKEQQIEETLKVIPDAPDGSIVVGSAGAAAYGQVISIDPNWKDESGLINQYRATAMQSEVDQGIQEIVTESIIIDEDDIVKLRFTDQDIPEPIQERMSFEFEQILSLLNFRGEGQDIFQNWYIDGRCYYYKIVDPNNQKNGILELQKLDCRNIKKVKEIQTVKNDQGIDTISTVNEYYVYKTQPTKYNTGQPIVNQQWVELHLSVDSISYCDSGIIDSESNIVLSRIHKAIRPANQLRMAEDAMLIARVSRAPERRIFGVPVGDMPKNKQEQYMNDLINRYKNRMIYNTETGKLSDDRKFQSLLEDYWIPVRSDGSRVQIDTLAGVENQGVIEEVEYLKQKLYKALNVPIGRLEPNQAFSLGRSSEITRDELKFAAFISKLRTKFSELFDDILKTQLILKQVISPEEWPEFKKHFTYDFTSNVLIAQLKEYELLQEQVQLIQQMDPMVGKYFSSAQIKRDVLRYDEEDLMKLEVEMLEDYQLQLQRNKELANSNAPDEQ